ncbi:helix-turn-helix transcriptional regulator [Nocardiopsis tropica]|uniref:Helix-turn-helix transcriptional regulator n=1 Tax=Nocardiopsis tropica TaxID=109330 RepID=A0ABU7KSP4_9ACTN|nr:helix-turn-helix transcriptional regulator [Nocardiopsis umidischolae]MEE2052316.1 helix-turn-helix transcriptional regulator [Nocardiopsis umidischolae]
MTDLQLVPQEEAESGPRAASPALRYYAAELKRHREAAGLTQAQLADLIPYSKSMVSMVETAKRSPLESREGGRFTSRFTECCDGALNTGGALERILPLLEDTGGPYPPWFRPYANLEAEATAIHEYQTQAVPGLLQTAEYARAVLGCGSPPIGADRVEEQVAARIRRQGVFGRKQPPFMWAVVDEIVLRRPIGGRDVLRRQLEHLTEVAQRPYVTFVVVPSGVEEHAALDGSFSILTFAEDAPLLYVEGRRTAAMTNLKQDVTPVLQSFMTLCAQGLSPRQTLGLLAGIMGGL